MEQKIIFAGPVGAGKTTAIASISDIPLVSTERKATDRVSQLKHQTTVAMDYGVLNLEDGLKIHLYGTPGQDRFDFMWDILAQGALGMVLLLDYTRHSLLEDLEHYLDAFGELIQRRGVAVVIGVTRMDQAAHPSLNELRQHLNSRGLRLPCFEIDARSHDDVRKILLALVGCLHPAVVRGHAG